MLMNLAETMAEKLGSVYFLAYILVYCETDATPSASTSGEQHPFYHSVKNVNTDPKSAGLSKPPTEVSFKEAKVVQTLAVKVKLGSAFIPVTLETTPQVRKVAMLAIQALVRYVGGNVLQVMMIMVQRFSSLSGSKCG